MQKYIRAAPYYCPFSHPSVLDPNEASPKTYRSERSEPEVPNFLQTVLRAKRSVQLKSKYVNRWGQIKSSQNGEITLSFTDEGKSCHRRKFYVANMSFNAIWFREN